MKKLYLMGLVGLLCAACSNDDFPGEESTQNQNLTGQERYMSVQLVSPEGTSSRASRAENEDATHNSETYNNGLEKESEVATLSDGGMDIMFYFFDKDGAPCAIDGTKNYARPYTLQTGAGTYSNVTWDDASDAHLTKISSAIIMLRNASVVPEKVVAVLNATGKIADLEKNYTLSELANVTVTSGYVKATSSTEKDKDFMMSNSVYMDETSKTSIEATAITSDNIWSNAKDAQLNPVNIYVERVVAKVEALSNKLNDDGYLAVLDKNGNPEKDANSNALYVKFSNWTTFDVSDQAYTLKHIDTTYAPTGEAAWTWNEPAAYRSFWADKTPFSITKQTLAYKDIDTPFGSGNYCYPFENTAGLSSAEGLATKVILAAKLYTKDESGTYAPATVCEFLGTRYTLVGLQTQIAGMLAKKVYKEEIDGENKTIVSVAPENIGFAYVPGSYTVKATLVKDGVDKVKNEEWVDADGKGLTQNDLNTILATIPAIKIWNEGMCYYYTYIKHLNSENAVIRNHWYQVNITKVTGLGTPVYDSENNTFDPTRPEDDEWVLGAKINIQSWRMVSQDYELGSAKTDDDTNEAALSSGTVNGSSDQDNTSGQGGSANLGDNNNENQTVTPSNPGEGSETNPGDGGDEAEETDNSQSGTSTDDNNSGFQGNTGLDNL
jgi:hypothetical protein